MLEIYDDFQYVVGQGIEVFETHRKNMSKVKMLV